MAADAKAFVHAIHYLRSELVDLDGRMVRLSHLRSLATPETSAKIIDVVCNALHLVRPEPEPDHHERMLCALLFGDDSADEWPRSTGGPGGDVLSIDLDPGLPVIDFFPIAAEQHGTGDHPNTMRNMVANRMKVALRRKEEPAGLMLWPAWNPHAGWGQDNFDGPCTDIRRTHKHLVYVPVNLQFAARMLKEKIYDHTALIAKRGTFTVRSVAWTG